MDNNNNNDNDINGDDGEKTIKDVIERFGDETSCHGLPRIIDKTEELFARLFWSCAVLFAFCMLMYMLIQLGIEYQKYSTTVSVSKVRTLRQFPVDMPLPILRLYDMFQAGWPTAII